MFIGDNMSFFEGLIVNIIFLMFPIFAYLLYVIYSSKKNKKKNEIFFDLMNLTALYLLIEYRLIFPNVVFLLLVNIPLVLSFIRRRYVCALALSVIIIIYYVLIYDLSVFHIIIEYIGYYIFFLYFSNKKKNYNFFLYSFVFIKGIILSFEMFYILPSNSSLATLILQVFVLLTIFYFLATLAVELIEKGEQFISLDKVFKELEKEKEIRSSLFKITHEIKNPIAVCKGYLDMMDYSKKGKVIKYNNIIKEEINRTINIMNDFMSYTKINVELERFNITNLLTNTIFLIQPMLNKRTMIKIGLDKDIYVNGDYERLKQVFVNIIKNSVEATNEFGIVTIMVKQTKKDVIITIGDNGCGMDKETLSHIQEAFFTTKMNGTGLGVPLTYEIIELHGGKIKYESKIGKGTKVTLVLQKYVV